MGRDGAAAMIFAFAMPARAARIPQLFNCPESWQQVGDHA